MKKASAPCRWTWAPNTSDPIGTSSSPGLKFSECPCLTCWLAMMEPSSQWEVLEDGGSHGAQLNYAVAEQLP